MIKNNDVLYQIIEEKVEGIKHKVLENMCSRILDTVSEGRIEDWSELAEEYIKIIYGLEEIVTEFKK